MCTHPPPTHPAPGPFLLVRPKVHRLGLKTRIWSGEGITLTFLLTLWDNGEGGGGGGLIETQWIRHMWVRYIKDLELTDDVQRYTSQLAQQK